MDDPAGEEHRREVSQEADLMRTTGSKAANVRPARRCSADFQSAVSQICNLRPLGLFKAAGLFVRSADCKSAIQQIENLRYEGCLHALLQRQSSIAWQSRAFTGLFTT